jgi:soluble lytic murein transglycosylase-like protein
MKHAKLVHLLASVLVVFVSISGCGQPPPPAVRRAVTSSLDDVLLAAKRAVEHAAEAKAARQLASGLSDGAELRAALGQADDAALKAKLSADEASSLLGQLDDVAVRDQVAAEVRRAQQAAVEAAAQRAAINRILLTLRKQSISSSMDEVTGRIVPKVRFNGDADEQQFLRNLLDEIVAGSFCDLLVDTVASGELPTQAGVQDAVAKNAWNSGVDFSGIYDVISKELIDVYYQFASSNSDELDEYKEACQNALTER